MSDKKPVEPSPQSIARANRLRLAQEEGARAMADVERQAVAVRKNMERLRSLREARDAQEAAARNSLPEPAKKKRGKSISK
ncbi:transcriptional regulator [Bradyrhizobium sp.]|uniref:transcriptional regulator n=1 Tax=Bradyrhizobium sp. TaxID=376 RepID=UPI00239DC759|nr:transcriptional regulator [Bradyrhizobium sp.]MDE2379894.1 transcriptional regulator [Bradyrhizobium sp.]